MPNPAKNRARGELPPQHIESGQSSSESRNDNVLQWGPSGSDRHVSKRGDGQQQRDNNNADASGSRSDQKSEEKKLTPWKSVSKTH
jgi:hypothetical protein